MWRKYSQSFMLNMNVEDQCLEHFSEQEDDFIASQISRQFDPSFSPLVLSLSLSEYKLCESSMVVCSLMAGRAEEAIGDPEKWVQDSDKSFHSNP